MIRTTIRRRALGGLLLIASSLTLAGIHRPERPIPTVHVAPYVRPGEVLPGPAVPCPECR